ncbi:MAG TPA: hypothetical protein VFR49_09240, partial [Solirubrobacteraceae bacterium]|nr:hypothetical protein [Solirubrobacteraceae bacterium]
MEQPGDGQDAATGEDRPVGLGEVDRYAPAVRAYLTGVCGADAADRLTPDVLGVLAGQGGVADPLATIASATRWAGLAWLRQNAGRVGRRRGGTRCRSIPDLLGERSEGRIQTVDLDRLYNHLSACGECAAMASQYDGGEWVLRRELLRIFPSAAVPAGEEEAEPPDDGAPFEEPGDPWLEPEDVPAAAEGGLAAAEGGLAAA